jgi:hypothetical protein
MVSSPAMSTKLLDTFVRISKSTRARLNAHCKKNNLQQGRFADAAILAACGQTAAAVSLMAGSNGHAAPRRKAAK